MNKDSKIWAVKYKRNIGWLHWFLCERVTGYGVDERGVRVTGWHSANTIRGLYRGCRREERNAREPMRDA